MIFVVCTPCNRVVSKPNTTREEAEFAVVDHLAEHDEVDDGRLADVIDLPGAA